MTSGDTRNTGRERRWDPRPRAGAGSERPREAAPSARQRSARSRPARGGGGAGPAGNRSPGRRHFSLGQRRSRGRGDSGHGERLRLRLRLRRRRRGETGPGAHHGAGEGADRRGQRTGALAGQKGLRGPAGAGSVPVRVAGCGRAAPLPPLPLIAGAAAAARAPGPRSCSRALSAADDGQVLSEVHREARRRPGQLRAGEGGREKWGPAGLWFGAAAKALCPAEVHRHVHGPVHGLLEHSFASLQFSAAAGESQHVTPEGPRGTMWGRDERPVQVVRGKSCCLLLLPVMAEQ